MQEGQCHVKQRGGQNSRYHNPGQYPRKAMDQLHLALDFFNFFILSIFYALFHASTSNR